MRTWFLTATLCLVMFAGCLAEDESPVDDADPAPAARPPATFDAGRVAVDVAVPVALVGFAPGTAAALQEKLPSLRPDANTYNNARLATLATGGAGSSRDNPMDPTAHYQYQEFPDVAAAFTAAKASFQVDAGLLDAVAAEDWLATALADAGFPASPEAPGIVLLHSGGGDSYRVQYPTGYVDTVRVFGERHPFTVMDLSAPVDPYVGTPRAFSEPLPADAGAGVLAEAVEAATWYRTLQGPIYPQSTDACHAVTLLAVTRVTSISQLVPGYSRIGDLVDADLLTGAWESLMGEGRVHVDIKVLTLPVDDPALDAVLREGRNEALRLYMDAMWDDYHVAHDGCEAYLSVFLLGDAADSGVSGIAMYDVNDDRRISMSWMNDLTLFQEQPGLPLYQPDPSRNHTDWVNFLFSHESGHLFGQRHPHDVSASDAPYAGQTFGGVWSAMSYQQAGKMPLFGSVDTNNYWRNRAGFLAEAAAVEFVDKPVFADALHLMGQYQWQAAGDALEPLVNGNGQSA